MGWGKMKRFYDTNILLHVEDLDDIEGKVYLASTTILELESIKTSRNKDDEIKFKSRRALRHIMENEDKYEIVIIRDKNREILQQFHLDETLDQVYKMEELFKKIHEDGAGGTANNQKSAA